MSGSYDNARTIRRGMLFSLTAAVLVITAMSAVFSSSVEARGATVTGATLTVKPAPSGGRDVIVTGTGFTAGKKILVDTTGPSLAPLYNTVSNASGSFSYTYTLPASGTWTFNAYEDAKGGWKFKVKTVYVQP